MRTLTSMVGFGLLLAIGVAITPPGATAQKPAKTKQEAEDPPKVTPEKPMSFWMTTKLNYGKSILEALTRGDFAKLEADAEQMRLIGKLEGMVRRNPNYRMQMNTFDSANLELVRQAKRHNIEGATLAYNQLTSSCVACHVMLREGVE